MPHASDPTLQEMPDDAPDALEESSTPVAGDPQGHDPRLVRWNLGALMLDVTTYSVGMAFLDMSAVLPLLLERLGATGLMIGAFAALRTLSYNGLQVFVAYAMHGRARQKPALVWFLTPSRLPLLILPFFLWRAAASDLSQRTALVMTIFLLFIWLLGDGLCYVPWIELVTRSFSGRTRGRFFATTQLVSGLVSILIAECVVRTVLKNVPYPHNYALLAVALALFMQISLVGVMLLKEPPIPAYLAQHVPRPPLCDYFRRIPALIRANPTFRRLALIQLLVGFGTASSPFYILYAMQRFGLSDQWGGIYQVRQALGVVALMPAWAYLSERRGPATAVRGVALAGLLTPLIALTLGRLHPQLFGLVFLLMGGSLGWGMWIVINHFLLSHIAEDERPIFLALLNLLFAPSALYPFFGGLLIHNKQFLSFASMPLLFVVTACVTAIGFVLALRLPAPDARS
jgi:uncharacterized membrane protein YjdF